jgi:ssDNA-binding replication factor A large subunit
MGFKLPTKCLKWLAILINLAASIILTTSGVVTKMSTEEVIDQILLKKPGISREQILEKLENEIKRTGGLISDETLLRMIAVEFGVEIQNDATLAPALLLKDLIPGLNAITVVGRVIAVFSPITFAGRRSGKLASLLIADKSGVLRVVLWDSRAGFVESGKIRVGQIVRFLHGYTREDRGGRVELHVGENGEIEVNPRDIDAEEYLAVQMSTTKIGEITSAYNGNRIAVMGTVKELSSTSNFKRRDSSSGRVMRFVLADETGETSVVVWNEKVDETKNMLEKGVSVQIVNAKVKKALGNKLELHVNAGTYLETSASRGVFLKIVDLNDGLKSVNVRGEVAAKPLVRDVKTSRGEIVKLAVFEFQDETGRIWVSAWREQADPVENLGVGDKIIIMDACVKKGFEEHLEVSTKNTTSIVKEEIGKRS